jgi:hypothetical protein
MARARRGQSSWAKGLTATTDARIAAKAARATGQRRGPYRTPSGAVVGDCAVLPVGDDRSQAYAYVLAIYLGDGHLARLPRTWALRIYLDSSQPSIIDRCARAVAHLNRFHPVGIRPRASDTVITSHGLCWTRLIPQHGPGRKHERKIVLVDWQLHIVRRHAEPFIRGLIESDGCRFDRVVNGVAYPAYEFTNRSSDIIELFCWAADLISIHYTRPSEFDVSIARRADVARLDAFIGPKS